VPNEADELGLLKLQRKSTTTKQEEAADLDIGGQTKETMCSTCNKEISNLLLPMQYSSCLHLRFSNLHRSSQATSVSKKSNPGSNQSTPQICK
jgi:hypothetical protein